MNTAATDIRELLPFWANGTLDHDERARVDAALAASSDLRAEAAALQALRHHMQAAPAAAGPGDLGLARLMRAIDADSPRAGAGRWRMAGLVAASAAVAAILSSVVTMTLTRGEDAVYEQASGDDPGTVLIVTFRPDATEAAIAALLRDRGLVIVDGPSAIGLYRIALPDDITPDDAARHLAAATGVIATVDVAE